MASLGIDQRETFGERHRCHRMHPEGWTVYWGGGGGEGGGGENGTLGQNRFATVEFLFFFEGGGRSMAGLSF